MAHKNFAVFDGDSHVVEPPELWTKYLEPEYRVLGRNALWREEGRWGSYLQVNGKMVRDTVNSNIPRHAIWRPGLCWKDIGKLNPATRHSMTPGASNPEARLKDMDAMSVDQAFLYPTWFAEGLHLIENPNVAYALARAYNNWIADFCAASSGRLFAAAILPLQHMDYTLEELRRVRSVASFRAALIRPMFIEGRYFTHPYYDPLWDELQRTGLAAAVHPTPGLWNPEWTSHGPFTEKMKGRLNRFQFIPVSGGGAFAGGGAGGASANSSSALPPLGHPIAPILAPWLDNHMFVASTLIGFTVMQRYPDLKVIVAHGKASWMEEVLEKMEASTRTFPLLHHYPVRTDTEELWEEGRVMLGFDAEERMVQRLPQNFVTKVVWGSRYPQHDTTSAWDAIDKLRRANIDEAMIARMLSGNAAAQFEVKLARQFDA
jgi:predicted TIM-barrel fold metal-dependent hydrolase